MKNTWFSTPCFARIPIIKDLKLNEDRGVCRVEYMCALTGKKCCPLYCPLKYINGRKSTKETTQGSSSLKQLDITLFIKK